MITGNIFSDILSIRVPSVLISTRAEAGNPAFSVEFVADGCIPFPQVVIWCAGVGRVIPAAGTQDKPNTYVAAVPEGFARDERLTLQIEGCRRANINEAEANDWIKKFVDVHIQYPVAEGICASSSGSQVRIYFGIHKHMHQPYYRAAEPEYWDGAIEEIFGTRHGAYTDYVADAVERYVGGHLPHAGLSTSWSGSLIEQLSRCARMGRCGGRFEDWTARLRKVAKLCTTLGNPRVDFSAFGFFHPLLPLIPHRDIVRSIRHHREIVRATFGTDRTFG